MESLPFIISIKNFTDKKIENVKVLDYDFKEQHDLDYSLLNTGIKYSDFLRFNIQKTISIGQAYFTFPFEYKNESNKDDLSPYTFTYEEQTECSRVEKIPYKRNLVSLTEYMIAIVGGRKYVLGWYAQIYLEYILPNTEIQVRLYPYNNENPNHTKEETPNHNSPEIKQ